MTRRTEPLRARPPEESPVDAVVPLHERAAQPDYWEGDVHPWPSLGFAGSISNALLNSANSYHGHAASLIADTITNPNPATRGCATLEEAPKFGSRTLARIVYDEMYPIRALSRRMRKEAQLPPEAFDILAGDMTDYTLTIGGVARTTLRVAGTEEPMILARQAGYFQATPKGDVMIGITSEDVIVPRIKGAYVFLQKDVAVNHVYETVDGGKRRIADILLITPGKSPDKGDGEKVPARKTKERREWQWLPGIRPVPTF